MVENFEIRDQDLTHLLFARIPSLQHLKIDDMKLLEGTGEAVVETLNFRHLSSFEMSSYYLIYEDDFFSLEPIRDLEVDDAERHNKGGKDQ